MRMRYLLMAMSVCFFPWTSTQASGDRPAHVSVGIRSPGVSIGINLPMYPDLVPVPGYPVYYDPRIDVNLFFYDGLYWVFHGDNWYASSWYNGPWDSVDRFDVPLFVLRVPVRYYRRPPAYFRGWRGDAPPRWGEHWGRDWEQRRSGWDRWDSRSAPPPAPLPLYQRQYSGDRYPRAPEQQRAIRSEQYRYQPHEPVTQRHFQSREQPNPPWQQERQQEQQRQQTYQRQQEQLKQQEQERLRQLQQQRQQTEERQQERQHQPYPQPDARGRGQEGKAAPQGKDRDSKAGPQDKGRKYKDEKDKDGKYRDEEREQDRRY